MTPSEANRGPTLVRFWFLLNGVALLLPPLHWWATGHLTPIAGLPATLFYFVALSTSITASVVVAYLLEAASGALQ
jgi:hypothetical protein